MKTCKKGLHQYEPVKGSRRGCLECRKDRKPNDPIAAAKAQKKYKDTNKIVVLARTRNWQLKNNFGIDSKQYEEIMDRQNGCCAICKRSQEELNRRMAVDHNHTTGQIRGLLCSNCNTGIGNLRDNVALLEEAIKYLNEVSHAP